MQKLVWKKIQEWKKRREKADKTTAKRKGDYLLICYAQKEELYKKEKETILRNIRVPQLFPEDLLVLGYTWGPHPSHQHQHKPPQMVDSLFKETNRQIQRGSIILARPRASNWFSKVDIIFAVNGKESISDWYDQFQHLLFGYDQFQHLLFWLRLCFNDMNQWGSSLVMHNLKTEISLRTCRKTTV